MLNFVRFPKTPQGGVSAFGALVVLILHFGKYKEMNYLTFLPSTKNARLPAGILRIVF